MSSSSFDWHSAAASERRFAQRARGSRQRDPLHDSRQHDRDQQQRREHLDEREPKTGTRGHARALRR